MKVVTEKIKFCAVLFCLFAAVTNAELRIKVIGGAEQAVPIAIVPFGWQGAGAKPFDVSQTLSNDLANSGRFNPLPPDEMLERPLTGRDIDFEDWRILGIEVVIVGQLLQTGNDEYTIQFQLFDVFRGKQLLGYRQPSTGKQLRRATHLVADMIYQELTGIRGIFSTRIAYITVEGKPPDQRFRLIVADADGENERILVDSNEPLMSPAWSPDGRKLAYVSFEKQQSEIYVQTLRSGARKRVSSRAGVNGSPAWSPDGRKLALTLSKTEGNLDIYILDLQSQMLTRLTNRASIDTEATWSKDGNMIYFTSDRAGQPQIYRIPARGGKVSRVSFEGTYNARPRISPSAEQVAVVHNDHGNYRIGLIGLDQGFMQVLTKGSLDESPSFAPNGESLIYATRDRQQGVLATVSVDGRTHRRISVVRGDVREPAWSPFVRN
ncbi:MAG: Tol-Pal system beta propeller repeat protein TolB [Gammaproteobacteria bacterium]|nr:Tol-Pal system beta propeller repeat protein TolB [Gammaproteobacteria bacterium]